MKIKALLLTAALLASMLFIMPMSASAGAEANIWITPQENEFWAPCQVSTYFTIEVKLWNKKDLTGVGIYGYDFTLKWLATGLISLVDVEVVSPWPEGKYFIAVNHVSEAGEEIEQPVSSGILWDWYQLSLTALNGADPLDEVQIVLVRLTFHIDKEPCWPDVWETDFVFHDVKLSSPCGDPVAYQAAGGFYTIYSQMPDMHISPTEITEAHISEYHTVEISLTNVTKVYDFFFWLEWNSTVLEADIQCVHITDLLPPPYEVQIIEVGDGWMYVCVIRPSEKPPISCGDGVIVTICFHSIFPLGIIPHDWDATIEIVAAGVSSKCPESRRYVFPDPPAGRELHVEGVLEYSWRPKPEDLNLDCHVDLQDLTALAKVYDTAHPWGGLANDYGIVDIYDFVVVAKRYCKD